MTRLIVDGRERADGWDHLAGGEASADRSFTADVTVTAPDVPARDSRTPGGRGFTVDAARWLEQRHDLIAHVERTGRPLGVRLAIDGDPMRLANDIGRFTLIVIEIPSSADGRFYSIAARLREHLHYRHELRVTGDVAPDQLSFMQRCGINAFELSDHVDIERFIRRYRCFYQSSGPLTTRDNLIRLARRHARSGRCLGDRASRSTR